jgi:hypothetical protein
MKKIFLVLAFIVSTLLVQAQEQEKTGFSLNNFLKNRQVQGDTIWQFKRFDVYQWVDDHYFMLHTAFVDWDSASPNYKSVLWINNNETDTAYKDIYLYDDSNRVISSINQQYINRSLVNYSKTDKYYNTSGFDSLYIIYSWNTDDSVWEKNKLRTLIYDDYNHLSSDVIYIWDGQNWQINYGRRSEHIYNEFGNVISLTIIYYHSEIHQWVNDSKTDMYLINDTTGEFNAYDVYFWKNGRWENGEKWTDVVYHDWHGWPQYQFELEYVIMQVWDGNRWRYEKKDSISYYPQGGSLLYQNWWDEENQYWYNGIRVRDEYNDHNFRKIISKEKWRNGNWDTLWADRYTFEYLNPDFWKVMNYEEYDTAINKWKPAYKHVFSEFIYYVLNTSEVKKTEDPTGLLLIPNPAKNILLIKLKDPANRISTIKVYNMTGKEVLKIISSVGAKQKQLDITFLKSGTYIINVQTVKHKVLSEKFIKY